MTEKWNYNINIVGSIDASVPINDLQIPPSRQLYSYQASLEALAAWQDS